MEQHKKKIDAEQLKTFGMRHVQSLLLFCGYAISTGLRIIISVAIVPMTDAQSGTSHLPVFDWNSNIKSLILSSLSLGVALTNVPMGYITSKSGAHKILSFSFFLAAIVNILTPTLTFNVGWVGTLFCRIITGMCQGCLLPCLNILIASWIPPSEKTFLGSFIFNGLAFGIVLSSAISGVLAESKFGWPSIFYFYGIISLFWSILYYFVGANTPSEHPRISTKEVHHINNSLGKLDETEEIQNHKFPWKAVLKSPPVWALLIATSGQGGCINIYFTQMPSYLTYILKYNIEKSGGIFSLSFLATWLMGFPFIWLSTYAVRKGISAIYVCKFCCTMATWGIASTLLVLCFVKPSNEYVKVSMFIIAMGLYAGTISSTEINATYLTRNYAGILISITNTLVEISALISPIICGYIVTDMSNEKQWNMVFGIMALVYFIINLIFIIFATTKRQPWDDQNVFKSTISYGTPRTSVISYM